MVFPLFFLYNNNAAIQPPPKTAADPAAEMQGEKMEICKISGSFLCLLNNNSGYDILELSFIPGGYNDAGITHIA